MSILGWLVVVAENECFQGNLSLSRSGATCVGSYNDFLADLLSSIRDNMCLVGNGDEMLDDLGRRVLEFCRGNTDADLEDILSIYCRGVMSTIPVSALWRRKSGVCSLP